MLSSQCLFVYDDSITEKRHLRECTNDDAVFLKFFPGTNGEALPSIAARSFELSCASVKTNGKMPMRRMTKPGIPYIWGFERNKLMHQNPSMLDSSCMLFDEEENFRLKPMLDLR